MEGGFENEVATILPGSVGSTELADGAVTSIKIANNLQSDNYDGTDVITGDATVGWRIERNTGRAEFQDLRLRGTILGTLTMTSAGLIRTSSGNDRLEISNVFSSRLDFYMGGSIGAKIVGGQGLGTNTLRLLADNLQINNTADTGINIAGFSKTQINFALNSQMIWSFTVTGIPQMNKNFNTSPSILVGAVDVIVLTSAALGNPNSNINVEARYDGWVQKPNANARVVALSIGISTDGGATWSGGSPNFVNVDVVDRVIVAVSHLVSNVVPTGSVLARVLARIIAGDTTAVTFNDNKLTVAITPR